MALPLYYNIRNLRVRWQVTLLSVIGIALVVAVFTVLMAMSEGFRLAFRETGREDNAMIFQRGSASELTSGVPLAQRNQIIVDDRVATDAQGQPIASWEWVIVIGLPKVTDGQLTNVSLRAVTPKVFDVRGGIQVSVGRSFTPGLDEVIVGRKIAERIKGLHVGGTVKYQKKEFKIVGLFSSTGEAFESEIWGDFDTLGGVFLRRGTGASTIVVRMKDPAQITALDRWMRTQPGMSLQALPEEQYYEKQAGFVSTALKAIAAFVALVTGVGAVFGAMNTMYAIVAARTREIGTLRALGFSRRAILLSFVVESALLALVGGGLGCLLAFAVHGYSTGTANLQSFSEVAYAFRVTPRIVASGMAFALVLGVAGGLLPSVRAARLSIAGAVREA